MNTERPDNDDAGGSAEERVPEPAEAAAEKDPGTSDAAEHTRDEEAVAAESEDGETASQGAEADAEDGEAESDAGPEAEAPDADATPDDDQASTDVSPAEAGTHGPVRRRSPLVVVSVAAAVLLVGGGGAYFAATASGGFGSGSGAGSEKPGSGSTPPLLLLDGYSAGGNGIAPGEPNPYGVTYRADGALPDGPDSAPVYRAKGAVTKEEVARLAKALGVAGTPVAKGQAWQVGPAKDGMGPSLRVDRQAPGAWTFHQYAAGTDNCKKTLVCTQDPANPAGDTVSEEAAKKAAAPVLKAVGQDDAKVDANQVMGAQRVVNADPVVGGLPTYGWTTGLTVSADGQVIGGSGRLKAPVKSDTYPVLSAEKTLALLNKGSGTDHRMGIGGCASPVPAKDRLEAPCGQASATPTPTPADNAITVEKAVFGLAAQVVDGQPALVPSWLFDVRQPGARDDLKVTYPAVDPRYVGREMPAADPTPTATAPSDRPTSAPKKRDVKVEGYTADGRELTVTFTGGVCADYTATASETSGEVTVKVTETPWQGKVCILIAKEIQKTVRLDEPLGDRKVVGSDGKAVPLVKPGARLPQTSGAR